MPDIRSCAHSDEVTSDSGPAATVGPFATHGAVEAMGGLRHLPGDSMKKERDRFSSSTVSSVSADHPGLGPDQLEQVDVVHTVPPTDVRDIRAIAVAGRLLLCSNHQAAHPRGRDHKGVRRSARSFFAVTRRGWARSTSFAPSCISSSKSPKSALRSCNQACSAYDFLEVSSSTATSASRRPASMHSSSSTQPRTSGSSARAGR